MKLSSLARPRWIVAGTAVLGLAAWALHGPRAAQARYDTAPVDRGDIVARVTATGTLSALVTVQVGSQVSGRIQALYADFNSPVKQGQIIARIDPALFEATVAQARANVAAAKGNLAKAKAQALDARLQAKRSEELFTEHLVSEGDRDTARANAESAQAGVAVAQGAASQAQAALHQAQINLAYTDIVSPTDGVVISRSVDVGQTVAASLQAPVLFTIAQDLHQMQVDTSVAEADIGRLTPGMTVAFTVDAYPNERFEGRVRQIRNAPQTIQNVVTYDAVIDVANPDLKLKPGMTANVTFVYAERHGVLRAPNAALRFRPPPELARAPVAREPAGERTLWVLRGGQPQAATVRTGVSDGSRTEIVDGDLHEGDRLITDMEGGAQRQGPRGFRIL